MSIEPSKSRSVGEAARVYVDRLLEEGFSVGVTDDDVVFIDPVDANSALNVRDPRRGLELMVHKKFVVGCLRQLGRMV